MRHNSAICTRLERGCEASTKDDVCPEPLQDLVSQVNETRSARHRTAFPMMVTKDGMSADAVMASRDIVVTVKTAVI